jgi:hypothetical protein
MSRTLSKCCRSTPRCAGCPVLVARRRKTDSATQQLIADVLIGRDRALPAAVAEQLELLAAARRRRRVAA